MGIDFRRPRHIRGFRLGEVMIFGPGIGKVLVEKTVSGAIANVPDGADRVPCKSVKCTVIPSGGNGTPDTPVPIVGASSVTVKQRGKNLLNPTLYDGGAYNPTVDSQRTFTESETQFTHIGNTYSVSFTDSWKTYTMLIPVKYGQAYYCNFTLSGTGTNLGTSVYFVDAENKVMASASNNTANPQTRAFAVNVPSGAKYFCITFTNRGTAETTLTFTEPQIEVGSSSSAFEAYNPIADVTAQIGQTVYGGEYNFDTGIFAENMPHTPVNLNSLTWTPTTVDGHACFFATLPNGIIKAGGNNNIKGLCSTYEITTTTHPADKTIRFYSSDAFNFSRVSIRDDDYATATGAEFKAAVQGNIVYELKEESWTEITGLDTHTFETVLGSNNFYCDSGDSEVTYYAYAN